jgi:hypothetical protein
MEQMGEKLRHPTQAQLLMLLQPRWVLAHLMEVGQCPQML